MNAKEFRKNLRQLQTPAERLLWFALRARRLTGIKFRRQCTLGDYAVDFYCPALKLVIEADGDVHRDLWQWQYDLERSAILSAAGYTVIRFSNEEIWYSLETVLEAIQMQVMNFDRVEFNFVDETLL